MEEEEEEGGGQRQREGNNSCDSDSGGGGGGEGEGEETAFEAERGDDDDDEEEVDVVDDDDDGDGGEGNNREERESSPPPPRNGFLFENGREDPLNGPSCGAAFLSPKELCLSSPLSAFAAAGTTTVSSPHSAPSPIFPTLVSPLPPPPPISLSLSSPSTHSALHSPGSTPPLPPPPSLGVPPPLLFQPFLPAGAAAGPSNRNGAERSALPFSIDNILKPSFGQRLRLLQSVAAAAAARERLRSAFQPRVIKSEPLLAAAPVSPPSSPSEPVASSVLNNNNNNRPVDLSSSSKASPAADRRPDSSSSPSSLPKKEKDPDCPPGMVRGPNGQLWPAWVFCTRYSDRPSSGEYDRHARKNEPRSGIYAT